MLLSAAVGDITFGQSGVYAVLGYAVVFFGLILLMGLIVLIGKVFVLSEKKNTVQAPAPVPAAPVEAPVAPGSAGAFKLHGVDPKTAAMAMAIVADKLDKPLNELRFISIKEVSE